MSSRPGRPKVTKPAEDKPTPQALAEVAKHAADISRHTAAWLADCHGSTDRAARRRIATCARDILELIGEEST